MAEKSAGKKAGDASEDMVPASATGIGSRVWLAGVLIVVMVFGCGGWAVTAELSGAVIAPGSVVVQRHVKKLQHREGGIVAEIFVKEGDAVNAGQTLIRLDETQTRAELGIIRSQLVAMIGRQARLNAERNGADQIDFPRDFVTVGPDAESVRLGETRLFEESRKTRESQREQLRKRIQQLEEEINGLSLQRQARDQEIRLIRQELLTVESLQKRQLTPMSRVYSMEREATRLNGDLGNLISQIARSHGQISELNLQILNIDQTTRTEAQKEMRTVEARIAELSERQIAAQDRLSRMELKAPRSGFVHELAVHTIGGVVSPAEPVLLIVPENEALAIEVRVSPTDIDQVAIGQKARLRFTAFNQRTTPEFPGRVVHVAADVTRDQKSGQNFYTAHIEVDGDRQDKLGEIKLMPGMPVEAFVATGDRTVLDFFLKPLTDQFSRAFKEE